MPSTALNRMVRGGCVGAMAVVLGSASHVMAGGAAPSAGTIVVFLAFAMVASSTVMASQVSMRRIAALTLGGQVLMHHVLALGGGGHHAHEVGPIDLSSLHAQHGGVVTLATVQMTLLHGLAALAMAWWLARGERCLWMLTSLLASPWTRALARLYLAMAPLRAALGAARAATPTFEPMRLRQQVWAFSTSDRGPPTGLPIRRLAVV